MVRLLTKRWLFAIGVLAAAALFLWACLHFQGSIVGGRYERYAGGGTFFGVRPVVLGDGKRLLFSTPLQGHGDLVIANLLGTQGRRVLSTPAYEGDADVGGDGAVAFIREDADFVGHVWIAPSLSEPGSQLTSEANPTAARVFHPAAGTSSFRERQRVWESWPGPAPDSNCSIGAARRSSY